MYSANSFEPMISSDNVFVGELNDSASPTKYLSCGTVLDVFIVGSIMNDLHERSDEPVETTSGRRFDHANYKKIKSLKEWITDCMLL